MYIANKYKPKIYLLLNKQIYLPLVCVCVRACVRGVCVCVCS